MCSTAITSAWAARLAHRSGLLVWKYAFRNAAVPLVTVLGVYFASMLGGAFVVEVIFAWPGLGCTVVEAVFARDFPVSAGGRTLHLDPVRRLQPAGGSQLLA